MDALTGAFEFGVRGLRCRLKFVVIGLREDVVLEEEFAAGECAIGADDFYFGFLEVGASGGDVAALKLRDDVTFLDLLTGQDAEAEHASAEGRKDVDNL